MEKEIRIGARQQFCSEELFSMHRLRARVFRERMGWDVPVISGLEIDGYDALDPYYMMVREDNGIVRGCWRLLPTQGPYMLRDTFPELLHGLQAPAAEDVWELSRFAIEAEGPQGFGFTGVALDAMREIVNFGDQMGIRRYVTVTTTSIERLLRKTGIALTRFGPPIRIGVENAVALDIDIGEQTHLALFDPLPQAA